MNAPGTLDDEAAELLAENAALRASNAEMLAALRRSAAQFEFYAEQHRQKQTADGDIKMQVNRGIAAGLRDLIARAEAQR